MNKRYQVLRLLKSSSFWLSIFVFVIALLPRITTLGQTFIVNDEPLYWDWSNDFARALVRLDWAGTRIGIGYPAITTVWVHTLSFAFYGLLDLLRGYAPAELWSRLALDRPMVFAMLGERRLTMGLANAVLILLIYWRARKLLGQPTALLGSGLIALAPFLLADARTMRGDALMSSLMLLSVLDFMLFLRDRRWGYLILSGFFFGLALLAKMTALPVAGLVGLAMPAYLLRQRRQADFSRLRRAVLALALWGGITTLTVFALWPALWVAPVEVLLFMKEYAASSIDGRLNYFWGELTRDEPLPLFYPVAFLFRANPIVIVGVLITTGLALVSGWRLFRARFSSHHGSVALDGLWQMPAVARWTLLGLGAYTFIYWLVLNAGALKRDRYLMPIFPAAMFIAAAGLLWGVGYARRRWPGGPGFLGQGRWAWLVLILWLGLELGHVLATHPYYYTYWSPLLGGGRVAMQAMLAEGGIDSAPLVQLSQRPNAENETVALLTARDYAPAYPGRVVRLVNNSPWVTADHVVLRQFHFQTEKMDTELLAYLYRRPPELVTEYQGYIWAWTYPGPAAQYYAGSMLEGKAELLGYNLPRLTASPAEPLPVKLFWRNHGARPPEQLYVRLVDAGGFTWAETVAQPLPGFEEAAVTPEAIVESEALVEIPPGTPPGLYFLKMGLSRGEAEPEVGQFVLPEEGSQITLEPAETQPALTLDWPAAQPLGPGLTLLGADVPDSFILTPHNRPRLTLYWQAEADILIDYVVSLSLLDQAGNEVAYWLGFPTHGIHPSSGWRQGELIRDPWVLDLAQAGQDPPPPGQYALQVKLFNSQTKAQVGQTSLGQVEVTDRQRRFTPPAMQQTVGARLGETISLLGYDVSQQPLTGGARVILDLYWQAGQPLPQDYTVFVQVLGPDGIVTGQHDSPPAQGTLPTTAWEAGEIITDRHQFDFDLRQEGLYRVIAGMYDPATGARLPVTNENGAPAGDFWELYTFTITAETEARQ